MSSRWLPSETPIAASPDNRRLLARASLGHPSSLAAEPKARNTARAAPSYRRETNRPADRQRCLARLLSPPASVVAEPDVVWPAPETLQRTGSLQRCEAFDYLRYQGCERSIGQPRLSFPLNRESRGPPWPFSRWAWASQRTHRVRKFTGSSAAPPSLMARMWSTRACPTPVTPTPQIMQRYPSRRSTKSRSARHWLVR